MMDNLTTTEDEYHRVCSYYGNQPDIRRLPVLYKAAAAAAIRQDRCICILSKTKCKAAEKRIQIQGGNHVECSLVCLESGSDNRLKCGGSDEDTKIVSLHWEKVKTSLKRIKKLPAKKTDRTIRCCHFHPKLFREMGVCSYIHDHKLASEIYGNDISNFEVPNIASTWYVVPLLHVNEDTLKNARTAGLVGTLKNARMAGNTPHRASKKNRLMRLAAKAMHALTPAKKTNKATNEFIGIQQTSVVNEMILMGEDNENMLESPFKKFSNTSEATTRPTYNTPGQDFFSHDNEVFLSTNTKSLSRMNSKTRFEDDKEMEQQLSFPSSAYSKGVSIGNGFFNKDTQTIQVNCTSHSSNNNNNSSDEVPTSNRIQHEPMSTASKSPNQKRKKKLPLLKKDLFGDGCQHDGRNVFTTSETSNKESREEDNLDASYADPPSMSSSASSFNDHLANQFNSAVELELLDDALMNAGMTPESPDANEETDVESLGANDDMDEEINAELLKAIAVIHKHIIQKNINDNAVVNGLAVEILELSNDKHRRLDPLNGSKFYSMKYKDSLGGGNTRQSIYCKLPKGRAVKNVRGIANKRRTSSETIQHVLDIICEGTDKEASTREVLNHIVEKEMGGKILWEDLFLDLDDCLTIRNIGRLSTNNTVRVLDAIQKLLGVENLYPRQLKKKIGRAEWSDLLSVKYISLEADVGQGKKKNCVFWWNPNVVHLLERLTTSAIVDEKFEDSIDFSSLISTTVFLHGIDRGGPDLVACLRLVNRRDGNSGEYAIPLSCFEDAHETYSNVVNATLSKERSQIFELFEEGVHIFHMIVFMKQDAGNEERAHGETARVTDTSTSAASAPFYAFLNKNRLICDAQSLMLQFKSTSYHEGFSARKLNVKVRTRELQYLASVSALKEFYASATHANASDREMPHVIDIDDEHITLVTDSSTKTSTVEFHAYLVVARDLDIDIAKSQDDGENEIPTKRTDSEEMNLSKKSSIVGVKLYTLDNHHLYSFAFAFPMKDFDASIYDTSVTCQRSMIFNADDGKMLTSLTGLGTASATYPCPCCIKRITSRDLPSWCERYREILGPTFTCKDAKPRTGRLSVEECSARYQKAVGQNGRYSKAQKGVLEKFVIDYCYSVSQAARCDLPQDIHGDALHIHAGILTHLNDEIFLLLQSIKRNKIGGGTTTWYQTKLDEALIIIKNMSNITKTDAYKEGMKICRKWNKELKQKQLSLQAAINSDEPESMIQMKQDELDNVYNIVQDVYKETGVGIMNLKHKGAEGFLALVKEKDTEGKKGGTKKKKKSTKRDKGELDEAEYLLKQSIRTHAGQFNVQHGPMELTCIRGMLALERRQDIYDTVIKAYKDSDIEANKEVKEIMDWWLQLSSHLYEMGKLMKSQEKMTEERTKKLEEHTMHYVKLWYDLFQKFGIEKSPLFWKLHMLLCGFIVFCQVYQMGGRVSTEGFENVHFWLNALRRLLAPIVNTFQRVSKISQRQQMFLRQGVSKRISKIKAMANKNFGTKRTKYNTSTLTRNQEDIVEHSIPAVGDDAPNGFYFTSDGNLLPSSVAEIESFLVSKKVPESFSKHFDENENLGSKAKLGIKFQV